MSENTGIAIITVVGIVAMIVIAYFFIKIMINTVRYSQNKK